MSPTTAALASRSSPDTNSTVFGFCGEKSCIQAIGILLIDFTSLAPGAIAATISLDVRPSNAATDLATPAALMSGFSPMASATDTGVAAISAPEAWSAVLDGRSILTLQDGMQLRRVKVMGTHRVELMEFTDGMVDRLKTFGLMSEIIAWKLRLFVPTGANGPEVLAALLARHPLTGIEDRSA